MRWIVAAVLLVACSSDDATLTSSKPTPAGTSHDAGTAIASPTDAGEAPVAPGDDDDDAVEDDHAGDATYYAPGTTGACGIKTPSDKLVGALGPSLYSKDNCGQCATVTGPKGSVTVLVNERCGGCKGESMDLSTAAFTEIADKSAGRVKITWHFTDCD